MKTSDIIASIGVTILLIAFFLNLTGKLAANSRPYTLMNFIGAAICGFSSFFIHYPLLDRSSTGEGVQGVCAQHKI